MAFVGMVSVSWKGTPNGTPKQEKRPTSLNDHRSSG